MAHPLPQPVRIYRVGGSVRDEMLGRPVTDRDYVVVGATPEILVASGFKPVGRDFPVFLHPDTREEYALARTERKQGRGYRGFQFFATPEVTLEDDLARRDLTINAMARADDGTLIDPHGGARDLERRTLRHVSSAFAEDPLRVLRVARFAARLEFDVAPETEALLREIADSGELDTLAPERIWQELARGLLERRPSRMLAVLRRCGALAQLLPEVSALFGVARTGRRRADIDAGVHVARALDAAAARGAGLPARYAVLAQNLGQAEARTAGPERVRAGVRLADRLSNRLKAPAECADAARLAARWRGAVERARDLTPAQLLDLLAATDALRRPERLDAVLAAAEADADPNGPIADTYPPASFIRAAVAVVKDVDAGAIARGVRGGRDAIAHAVRAARLKALREWKRAEAKTGRRPRRARKSRRAT